MNLHQLTNDVAEESLAGNPHDQKMSIILTMIIGAIITNLIEWFIQHYILPHKAETEFSNYYRNMNAVRRVILKNQVRRYLEKSNHHELFSASLITRVLEKKFKQLTEDDLRTIFNEIRKIKKERL